MTQEELKHYFDYINGNLIWRKKSRNKIDIGDTAGCLRDDGYKVVRVDGKLYLTHRLIFLWHYGYLPEKCVDHINRNRSDNRIENLREVSNSCNGFNAALKATNTSGIKGVYKEKATGKYRAQIRYKNRMCKLGRFNDLIEAAAHRLAAEQCIGISHCEDSPAYKCIQNYKNINVIT